MIDPQSQVKTKPAREGSRSFHTVVKNNLHFWLRRFPWEKMPDVTELSLEKENILKGVKSGLRFRSTYRLTTHFIFTATDMMLHVGSNREWLGLIQKALDLCPADAVFIRGRLNLCQAKQMLQDQQFDELQELLPIWATSAESNQDIDLLWEIKYMQGMVECHYQNFAKAFKCIDGVSNLLKKFTLLNPHLCKGKIATLGSQIGIAQRDWSKAGYCLDIAIHHLEKCGADYSRAIALELFGEYYEQQSKTKEALHMYEKAVSLIPEGFSFQVRSRLETKIARTLIKLNRADAAQGILEGLDYGMMRLLGCHYIHLDAILLLSEVMRAKGANRQAELILENAEFLRSELAQDGDLRSGV